MAKISLEMIEEAYHLAGCVRRKEILPSDATHRLVEEYNMSSKSAVAYMHALRHLFRGDRYTRRISNTAAQTYLANIERDEGTAGLRRAINSYVAHTDYLEAIGRQQAQPGMRRIIEDFSHRVEQERKGEQIDFLSIPLSQLREMEQRDLDKIERLDEAALKSLAEAAPSSPAETINVVTTVRRRNAAVKAYTLRRANGVCDRCQDRAPFKRGDGTPFLEVHHKTPLADDGPDTTDNTVALCPNCHREAHYGAHRKDMF